MKVQNLLVLLVAGVSLSSCGRKLDALSKAQKDEFTAALQGVANPLNAVQSQSKKKLNRLLENSSSNSSDQMDDDYIPSELNDDFETACEAEFNFKGDFEGVPKAGQTISVNGFIKNAGKNECPIVLGLDFNSKIVNEEKMTFDLDLNYEIQNDLMKKENDITAFAIKGDGSFSGTQKGDEATGKADFKSTGSLTSTRNGEVEFYFDLEASGSSKTGMTAEAKLGMEFKDFTAELKVVQVESVKELTKTAYYLNNEEITEKEFNAFFEKFNRPEGTSPGRSRDSDSFAPAPIGDSEDSEDGFTPQARMLKSMSQMPLLNSFTK